MMVMMVMRDHTTLRTNSASIEEFIELLVYKIDNLTAHSLTAKSPSRYLKKRKEEINNVSCFRAIIGTKVNVLYTQ